MLVSGLGRAMRVRGVTRSSFSRVIAMSRRGRTEGSIGSVEERRKLPFLARRR